MTPDRYQLSHLRTLQRGVRKIRTRLAHVSVQSQEDGTDETVSTTLLSEEHEPHDEANELAVSPILCACTAVPAPAPTFSNAQEELASVQDLSSERVPEKIHTIKEELVTDVSPMSNLSLERTASCKHPMSITIEETIGDYLAAQQQAKRRPKTMEWHQTALRLFGQYLRTECQCVLLVEMTEGQVQGWVKSLRIPTARGMVRSANTRRSYACSTRAWCQWLVNAGYLRRTPFATISLPKEELPVMHPLETEEWERFLLACESSGEHGVIPE